MLRTSRSSRRARPEAESVARASARNSMNGRLKIESRASGVSGVASVAMRTVSRTGRPDRDLNDTVRVPVREDCLPRIGAQLEHESVPPVERRPPDAAPLHAAAEQDPASRG